MACPISARSIWAGYDLLLEVGRLDPRDAKLKLAYEIVESLNGPQAAQKAQAHFEAVFQRRELPADMPAYSLATPLPLIELLALSGLARSKSQARRLIEQGGVRLDGRPIEAVDAMIEPPARDANNILQVGRRRFLRLVRESR